jgi:hypothetical protein
MAIFELTSTIIPVDSSALRLRIDQASAHDDLIQFDLACMDYLKTATNGSHILSVWGNMSHILFALRRGFDIHQ